MFFGTLHVLPSGALLAGCSQLVDEIPPPFLFAGTALAYILSLHLYVKKRLTIPMLRLVMTIPPQLPSARM